jgi:hypothetical protein
MQNFVFKPSVELIPGVKVTKDTVLEYEREGVKQTLKDLVFRSITTKKGDNFESVIDTIIYLNEGDILAFEDEGRGYIKPIDNTVVTIEKAIADLENIKDLG